MPNDEGGVILFLNSVMPTPYSASEQEPLASTLRFVASGLRSRDKYRIEQIYDILLLYVCTYAYKYILSDAELLASTLHLVASSHNKTLAVLCLALLFLNIS